MRFNIYQIELSNTLLDAVNELGHIKAAKQYPQWYAHLDTSIFGSEHFKPDYLLYYSLVCEVECDTVTEAFFTGTASSIGNIISQKETFRDVQVGDIIEDENGNRYIVNKAGFGRL